MSSRSFFHILLKISALLIFADSIFLLIQFVQTIYSFDEFDLGYFITWFLALFVVAFIIYALLFKGNYIINKLKLTENIDDYLTFNMHRSDMLSIAIIVLGGYILVDEIPVLCKTFYNYWWEGKLEMGYSMVSKAPFSFSAAKILVGLLLLGNTKLIVNYLELRRKK